MKKIFFLLFFLSALPVMSAVTCEIDYLKFCEHQDPRIPNMCPQVLGHHLKETCVVTKEQSSVIRKTCAKEMVEICRSSDADDFLTRYICLTNPEKWERFSPECLKSLVKGNPHH